MAMKVKNIMDTIKYAVSRYRINHRIFVNMPETHLN